MTPADLTAFTAEVAQRFDAGQIHGPVHLNSETQIVPLIEIFRGIQRTDWVLSNWRSMYHAILHGVPRDRVMAEVCAGRSMQLHFPEHRFMTSSIMGGMLPIACGLAAAGERVWCFVGDMCASTGAFHDVYQYVRRNVLSVEFVIEDNGLSTNSPTQRVWGVGIPRHHQREIYLGIEREDGARRYTYTRTTPHYGTGNGTGF